MLQVRLEKELPICAQAAHRTVRYNMMYKIQYDGNCFIYLFLNFIYFWLCWVFVAVRGLSLVTASGGYC